jgi:hypothetical integral membrane protein (TIGR02206 family)
MNTFSWYGTSHLLSLALCLFLFGCTYFYAKSVKQDKASDKAGAWVLAAGLLLIQLFFIYTKWKVGMGFKDILPLHLCDFSALLLTYMLLTEDYRGFQQGYYWGMAGGVMALLMPELEKDDWYVVPFFLWHIFVVIAPFYLVFTKGLRPTHAGIFQTAKWTVALSIFVALVNWLVGANFMFLCEAPMAVAGLFPPFPWHNPLTLFLGIIIFYAFYFPFAKKEVNEIEELSSAKIRNTFLQIVGLFIFGLALAMFLSR